MQELLENKSVYIFDLDGVLIDSVDVWNQIDAYLIKLLTGKEIDTAWIGSERNELVGRSKAENPYNDYVRFLCEKYNIDKSWEDVAAYRVQIMEIFLKEKVTVMPYAVALLQALKKLGKKLVLASTTSRRNINTYVLENKRTQALEFTKTFDVILTMDDIHSYKPEPEIHLKALRILNAQKEDCVIIEDSLVGVSAANNAGIDVIAVREEHSILEEESIRNCANYYIDSLKLILESALNKGAKLEKKP